MTYDRLIDSDGSESVRSSAFGASSETTTFDLHLVQMSQSLARVAARCAGGDVGVAAESRQDSRTAHTAVVRETIIVCGKGDDPMEVLSGMIVVAFGVFLIGLAGLIAIKPQLAERVLRSFASSARAHYTEQASRLIAGGALVSFAPSMWYPNLFKLFGWLIVLTAVALLLLPWRWHYEFSKRAIPLVIRHMTLFAVGAVALGILVFYGVSRVVLS